MVFVKLRVLIFYLFIFFFNASWCLLPSCRYPLTDINTWSVIYGSALDRCHRASASPDVHLIHVLSGCQWFRSQGLDWPSLPSLYSINLINLNILPYEREMCHKVIVHWMICLKLLSLVDTIMASRHSICLSGVIPPDGKQKRIVICLCVKTHNSFRHSSPLS